MIAVPNSPAGIGSTMKIVLRDATGADDEFLLRLYASTRAAEMAPTGWDDATCAAFVRMQFDMQRRSYRMQFPAAQCQVIERDGTAVGRLWLNRGEAEIRVLDIALLPPYRAQGVGSQCLRSVLAEARQAGAAVRLSVDVNNPARRLYERLGLVAAGADTLRLDMEWLPTMSRSTNASTAKESCNEQA